MSECMTIESFFIAEYERLRKENEELKETIEKAKLEQTASQSEKGFTDLSKKVEAVRYTVNGSYNMFTSSGNLVKLTIDELRKINEKDDANLWKWATETNIGSYYGYVAKREAHTFPFSVSFTCYKGTTTYAYDPDKSKCELTTFECQPCLDSWVLTGYEEGCKAIAVQEVRENIMDRIEKLEKEQQ